MEKDLEEVVIGGHKLICPHCQNEKFHHRNFLLNTQMMTFFNLDWANQMASNFICSNCGRIEWFTRPYDPSDAMQTAYGDTECLACGATIPHNQITCPECKWTYKEDY